MTTMAESYTSTTSYTTIDEIRSRKALLLKDIQKDSERLDQQWHSLFRKPTALTKGATPSQRISSMVSAGAGMIDGIILVWKLYRKFKR